MTQHKTNTDVFSYILKHRTRIMGVAAVWIIIFHTWSNIFSQLPILNFVEKFIVRIGFVGVDIFFYLSGMGLVYSIKKSSTINFYYKRAKRIVLPFILIALLKVIFDNWSMQAFCKAVTGYSFYFESMYTFLWFVPAIMTLYFVFPFYNRILEKAKNPLIFTVVMLEIWMILSIKFNLDIRQDLYGFTNRIPVFLLGIMCAHTAEKQKIFWSKESGLLITTTLFLGLYLAYLTNYADFFLIVPVSNSFLPNLLITISLCPILAYIFDKLPVLSKFFSFFGTISFELYCIQEWISAHIRDTMLMHMPRLAVNISLILIVTIIANILYKINIAVWKPMDKYVLKDTNRQID